MISIFEPPVRNSGIIGGKFLGRTKVVKSFSPVDNPIYYGPSDFFIGAVIDGKPKRGSEFPGDLENGLFTAVTSCILKPKKQLGCVLTEKMLIWLYLRFQFLISLRVS